MQRPSYITCPVGQKHDNSNCFSHRRTFGDGSSDSPHDLLANGSHSDITLPLEHGSSERKRKPDKYKKPSRSLTVATATIVQIPLDIDAGESASADVISNRTARAMSRLDSARTSTNELPTLFVEFVRRHDVVTQIETGVALGETGAERVGVAIRVRTIVERRATRRIGQFDVRVHEILRARQTSTALVDEIVDAVAVDVAATKAARRVRVAFADFDVDARDAIVTHDQTVDSKCDEHVVAFDFVVEKLRGLLLIGNKTDEIDFVAFELEFKNSFEFREGDYNGLAIGIQFLTPMKLLRDVKLAVTTVASEIVLFSARAIESVLAAVERDNTVIAPRVAALCGRPIINFRLQ